MIPSLLLSATFATSGATDLSLVPTPREHRIHADSFRIEPSVVIVFDERPAPRHQERSLEAHALAFAEEIELLTGVRPRVARAAGKDDRTLALNFAPVAGAFVESELDEAHAYTVDVTADRVDVSASYSKGVAHGSATLLQALVQEDGAFAFAGLAVDDAPASPYRAVLIDVARSPHSIEVLQDVVRLARLYKLRYIQLHLTDDQLFTFPFEPVTSELERNTVYPRAELRALVDYADARGVTLVPEIDLPGHSSRLIESGYLPGAEDHADVASREHFERIHALIDDVLDVFDSSPYLHIGGDESGAGEQLVPFLASMQAHVRSRGRRLVVWEGFHGAPTDVLPPRGEDRILVAAWESSYNPPWNLLAAGYELINASWKPLYVVGGGSRIHPGSSGGRKWPASTIAAWDKDSFWHWEPGRPVFEDAGPKDPDRGDSAWSAEYVDASEQILGAQVCVWEQHESSVIDSLRERIPVFAERVWSEDGRSAEDLLRRSAEVDARIWPVVQPVEILPAPQLRDPLASVYRAYEGEGLEVRLVNRTRIQGTVRYEVAPFRGSITWIEFPDVPRPLQSERAAKGAFRIEGGAVVRAQLIAADGRALGGGTWARFLNWPNRVRVTEFDVERGIENVPDLAEREASSARASYELPMIRGPLEHVAQKAQRFDARLQPPAAGEYTLSMKTQSGRASLYLDLDRDGQWSLDERLITDSPRTEELQSVAVQLDDQPRALRIDHVSALPRPVLLLYLEGPGTEGREEITRFLLPLDE